MCLCRMWFICKWNVYYQYWHLIDCQFDYWWICKLFCNFWCSYGSMLKVLESHLATQFQFLMIPMWVIKLGMAFARIVHLLQKVPNYRWLCPSSRMGRPRVKRHCKCTTYIVIIFHVAVLSVDVGRYWLTDWMLCDGLLGVTMANILWRHL